MTLHIAGDSAKSLWVSQFLAVVNVLTALYTARQSFMTNLDGMWLTTSSQIAVWRNSPIKLSRGC
ncbi:hypothetical protein B6N60_00371 [Richelia sinica FACHB-800]|uniref:Uncharacterized protein n=1 Tax=Richelia sinica FACHB-800 TaxID=1357546 RepID=A0A975T412_9NOST|nr:hypothetical protein [Richelia sinica]MBD2662860.1 hypothetical protein [Richelia sinica FACHB-800]QXE21694.1 hypothetical protein B6N60_00371 [Richelia sinica FACHB-800]